MKKKGAKNSFFQLKNLFFFSKSSSICFSIFMHWLCSLRTSSFNLLTSILRVATSRLDRHLTGPSSPITGLWGPVKDPLQSITSKIVLINEQQKKVNSRQSWIFLVRMKMSNKGHEPERARARASSSSSQVTSGPSESGAYEAHPVTIWAHRSRARLATFTSAAPHRASSRPANPFTTRTTSPKSSSVVPGSWPKHGINKSSSSARSSCRETRASSSARWAGPTPTMHAARKARRRNPHGTEFLSGGRTSTRDSMNSFFLAHEDVMLSRGELGLGTGSSVGPDSSGRCLGA
ncbi:phosphotransferases [Striga asiatica]|uniref:Phosphotransferases n=1 Tax=Striga asiatica TaxID=4170 RepID=A0A5A7QTV1_STRAF|nr:phosphotransferases [Striga asiatica]